MIQVRKMGFELPPRCRWNDEAPEVTYLTNAWALALPALEAYFVRAVRESLDRVTDERVVADAIAYCKQEAEHARHHQQLNQRMYTSGWPWLETFEGWLKRGLERSRKRHGLQFRMACTAGYEAVTYQIVRFFFQHLDLWFGRADPTVSALLVWHGVEEVEHKEVAFDVYQSAFGSYGWRILGYLAATTFTAVGIGPAVLYMAFADGRLHRPSFLRRLGWLGWLHARDLVPELRHYLRRDYHPSQESDPADAAAWMARYAAGQDLERLDTRAPAELFR